MPVRVTLDVMLARRKLRARDVAETLSKLCLVLECAPGDLLEYDRDDMDLSAKED